MSTFQDTNYLGIRVSMENIRAGALEKELGIKSMKAQFLIRILWLREVIKVLESPKITTWDLLRKIPKTFIELGRKIILEETISSV